MKTFTMKLGIALTLPVLGAALFSLGCVCDGWHQYASATSSVTIDAGTAAVVPLRISIPPASGGGGQNVGIELHVDDCSAGMFDLDSRLLRADGTTPTTTVSSSGGSSSPSTIETITCPGAPSRFTLAASELTCTSTTCTADLRVSLASPTGVGPRRVEVRLAYDVTCAEGETRYASSGHIDAWGM